MRVRRLRHVWLLVGIVGVSSILGSRAHALAGYLSMGYGRGGTHLRDLTGGQNYNTQAGSGLFLTGGALLTVSDTIPHRFEAQLGLGYMFQDDAREELNSTKWSRVPIEALYYYRNTREMFRFGWGATYHVFNRISGKGANLSVTRDVENAFGWVVAGEKLFNEPSKEGQAWGLGLKYVWLNYKSSSFVSDADANTWYLTFSLLGK
ncbi:MAG: hypothetical protein V4760_16145 [Bdellovibrionota bacterium]